MQSALVPHLWRECWVRGPCAPCSSGRQHASPSAGQASRSQLRAVQTHVAANASLRGPATTQPVQRRSGSPTSTSTWSMETVDDDDAAFVSTPVNLSSSKPLRINLDLRLYRARLARIQAALSTDPEAKRALLRDAEEALRACLAMEPSDPRGYVVLGKLLVQQKRYDEARKLYADGTTATGNTSPYIWASWGYLESLTGQVSRARKLFDAAIVVDGSHAAAWHKWGMLEMRQGNYLRARDLWTSGINRCRRSGGRASTYLYCSLAVMAAELGKLSEARAWFQEGTRLAEGRSSCALWHAWAMTEGRLGDPSAVRYLFKQALAAHPRSRYTHLAWAMWERKQGNPGVCLQLLARGSALNPADPALLQAAGVVEKEGRRFEAARQLFRRGLEIDPRHLHLWQAWGVMEYQLGAFEEARRLFQEGVWADPGNKDVVYIFQAWGVLERKAGNAPLARELFKAALKVDPKNESTWSSWIQMEEDMGRLEAANELRIRRGEQQWEFVIPSSFTTRPDGSSGSGGVAGGGGDGAGAAGTGSSSSRLLTSLLGTLNAFFSLRGSSSGSGSAAAAAAAGGSRGDGSRQQLMAELLPADYRTDLTLEDIISEASALDVGGSSSSSSRGGAAVQQQAQQQQQQLAAAPAGAGASSSGSSNGRSHTGGSTGEDGSSSSSGGDQVARDQDGAAAAAARADRNKIFQRRRQQERAAGLQRPVRPSGSDMR